MNKCLETRTEQHMKNPKISVIIPVYNEEIFLNRCVESIVNQSYENLEIILVNDCSSNNSPQLCADWVRADERIKLVSHEMNRGLFQARLTGYENATGEYIAFVDSDDYISIDWFRLLLRKAENTMSDMVVGEWCYDFDGKHRDYLNMEHFRLKDYCLEGSQVLDALMDVQGRNFSWTVVWNKLYTKNLWDQCYDFLNTFSKTHGHMLMWEDIAFSSVLWTHAKKVTNVHGALYFYYKHEAASTHLTKDIRRNEKYIRDASAAIALMKSALEHSNQFDRYESEFTKWKQWHVGKLYRDLVIDLGKKRYIRPILEAFGCESDYRYQPMDEFFHSITSPLHMAFDWLEDLKKQIASEKTRYVSFDVFDTLIQRPFFYPSDLFQLLSEELNQNLSSYVNFKMIRQSAEETVRQEQHLHHPSVEEITLDQIYDYISSHYSFSQEMIHAMKSKELEMELRYCEARQAGKELMDYALECGKKVIICSDMYLSKTFIAEILAKNDITGYSHLYVSSEVGLTKSSKHLFEYVQKNLNELTSNSFIHIGDSWNVDIENARACGWRSAHLPKATDILMGNNPGIYSGEAFCKLFQNAYFKEDYRLAFNDFTAIRNMMGTIANQCANSPFVSVNPASDFNADPRMVGYAALGPHLLALCKWIHAIVQQRNIGTVHFVARDGYLVKAAYDSLGFTDSKTNYLRLSRKALILCDIERKEDLYSLYNKMSISASPEKIAQYLEPIIPKEKKETMSTLFKANGFRFDRELRSNAEWADCMKVFIDKLLDFSLLPAYKEKLRSYFSQFIHPGDFIFDVGYNGRPESALSAILGFPVGSMYIHVNSDIAGIRQEMHHCPSHVFYEFKPCVTGVIREHLLMELGPSTVGFREVNGSIEPEFEPYEEDYSSVFVTSIIHDYALRFVKDYYRVYSDFQLAWNFQNEAASAVFEYFVHRAKEVDRRMMVAIPFEDSLNETEIINAYDFWTKELSTRNIGSIGSTMDSNISGDVIPGLYVDGYLMKFILFINRIFPRGGKMRETLKRIAARLDRVLGKR